MVRPTLTDPFGTLWRTPDRRDASVLTMPTSERAYRLPILSVPGRLDDEAQGSLDDRTLDANC
jgi:hypothetical protein